MKVPVRLLLTLFTLPVTAAAEFVPCRDVLVDQVTGTAFGMHGAPYSGEVICYHDPEETVVRYRRVFSDGIAVDEHVCYDPSGKRIWSITYEDGKKVHYGFAPHFGAIDKKKWLTISCDKFAPCKKRDFSQC